MRSSATSRSGSLESIWSKLPVIEWQPISRAQFIGWLVFYGLLLGFLAAHFAQPTFLDNADLIVHEAGHLLFSYLGATMQLWGGTIFQLLVPLLLVISFAIRGQVPGVVFSSVAFFHNCLYIANYMTDALRRELPLVTVGAVADESDHDWVRIFSDLGVLSRAIQIGSATRWCGWAGLLLTMLWFWRKYCQQPPQEAQ